MNEMEFSQKIDDLGGTLYIVGGWVRDKIRGVIPKDKDFVICHVKEEDFKQNFPKAKKVSDITTPRLAATDQNGRSPSDAFSNTTLAQRHGRMLSPPACHSGNKSSLADASHSFPRRSPASLS